MIDYDMNIQYALILMSYFSCSPMHSAGRSGGLGGLVWPGSGPTRDCSHVGWLGRGCPDAQDTPLGHSFYFYFWMFMRKKRRFLKQQTRQKPTQASHMLTQLPELFIEAFRVSTEQRKAGAFWWNMSSDGGGIRIEHILVPTIFFRVQILVACGAGAGLAAVRQGNTGDWSCCCCCDGMV